MAAEDKLTDIRSRVQTTSLILSLVRPRAVEGFVNRSRDSAVNQQLELLDRLSLFFVKKPGDVAAISTSTSAHAVDIWIASSSESHNLERASDQEIDGLRDAVETQVKRIGQNVEHMPSTKLEHWLDIFNTAISPLAHMKQLERLLSDRSTYGRKTMGRYVLFFCLPKIHSRLSMKYFDQTVFLDTIRAIGPDQVRASFSTDVSANVPSHIRDRDETQLRDLLPDNRQNTLQFSRDRPHILERSARNEGVLWAMLKFILTTLNCVLKDLLKFRKNGHKPEDVNHIESLLDGLHVTLTSLNSLVSRSPSFWLLLHNRAVVDAIEASRGEPRPTAVPVQSAVQEEVPDHSEDAEDPEEIVVQPGTNLLREWLKLLTPWPQIFRDFEKGSLHRLLASHSLIIHPIPIREHPVKDEIAPLEDVLSSLGRGHPKQLLATLRESVRSNGMYTPLLTHNPGDPEYEQELKKIRRVAHCECQLASSAEITPDAIGVSKRCCFICHRYLKYRGILHSGSHGKIGFWTPPAGANREILQHIDKELQNQLHIFFNEAKARRDERRPSRDLAGTFSNTSSEGQGQEEVFGKSPFGQEMYEDFGEFFDGVEDEDIC